MSESSTQKEYLKPDGTVDSQKVYDDAAKITTADLLKAVAEFDKTTPKYKGLLLVQRGVRIG